MKSRPGDFRTGFRSNPFRLLCQRGNRAATCHQVLAVPESTVEFSGDSTFVYLMTDSVPKQKFQRTQVTTGMSDGIKIEIKKGITAQDKIRGAEKKDKIQTSMKTIRKTISVLLFSGIGIISIQAQDNNSSQTWTLRQCIDYAIEHNTGIRKSANDAEISKVDVHTTKWARLPNLSGSASQNWSWGRTASPVDNSYSDINSANTSFSLGTNVPIFTGLQLPINIHWPNWI